MLFANMADQDDLRRGVHGDASKVTYTEEDETSELLELWQQFSPAAAVVAIGILTDDGTRVAIVPGITGTERQRAGALAARWIRERPDALASIVVRTDLSATDTSEGRYLVRN